LEDTCIAFDAARDAQLSHSIFWM